MISVDTNVILSALNRFDVNYQRAREHLVRLGASEVVVISTVVYAELMASPDQEGIRAFLERADIPVLWSTPQSVWERSGSAFGAYAVQRRGGSLPRRIVADFVIAAHAEHHKLGVLTFDDTVYKAVFPELTLLGTY